MRALQSAASGVEFENTNALGKGKRYSRLKVPGSPYIYPAFDLNHAFEDTDVFVSMAKLKNHETCGVTLSLKNCFGNSPASTYGDDAGVDEPNENPTSGRGAVCHAGQRQPSKSALPRLIRPPAAIPATVCPTSWPICARRGPLISPSLMASNPFLAAKVRGSSERSKR